MLLHLGRRVGGAHDNVLSSSQRNVGMRRRIFLVSLSKWGAGAGMVVVVFENGGVECMTTEELIGLTDDVGMLLLEVGCWQKCWRRHLSGNWVCAGWEAGSLGLGVMISHRGGEGANGHERAYVQAGMVRVSRGSGWQGGNYRMRGRGAVVVVRGGTEGAVPSSCGRTRRSAVVVVLPVWREVVGEALRTRRGQGIVACGRWDEVGEDDASSLLHGRVVVVVVARWWWSHPRLHSVVGDDDGEGEGAMLSLLSSLLVW